MSTFCPLCCRCSFVADMEYLSFSNKGLLLACLSEIVSIHLVPVENPLFHRKKIPVMLK